MSNVICDNINCPYHGGSVFCTKAFIMLNQAGMCFEIFEKNGQPKMPHQVGPDCEYKGGVSDDTQVEEKNEKIEEKLDSRS